MKINALMKHLRKKHKINITGSKNKQELKNLGYYHTYKGYRYVNSPDNVLNFKDFNEIVSLYRFDSKLKELFYPKLMTIETISKNRVLQILIEKYKTDEFNVIYDKGMNDNSSNKDLKKNRLRLRTNIYNTLANNFGRSNNIVTHFYSKDRHVPIWGIFEIITLGEFSDVINCLNSDTKRLISLDMNLVSQYDSEYKFPETIIRLIKDLRNAVAHNSVIFDVRFKKMDPNKNVKAYLQSELGTNAIQFNSIVDYFLLIAVLLHKFEIPKREIVKFINDFDDIIEEFRKQIDIDIFSKIIFTDKKAKLNCLKSYIN